MLDKSDGIFLNGNSDLSACWKGGDGATRTSRNRGGTVLYLNQPEKQGLFYKRVRKEGTSMNCKNGALIGIAVGILCLCWAPSVIADEIIINEWCVNKGSKWIELYNTTNREVDVTNYVLTDKKNEDSEALEEVLGRDHGINSMPPRTIVSA